MPIVFAIFQNYLNRRTIGQCNIMIWHWHGTVDLRHQSEVVAMQSADGIAMLDFECAETILWSSHRVLSIPPLQIWMIRWRNSGQWAMQFNEQNNQQKNYPAIQGHTYFMPYLSSSERQSHCFNGTPIYAILLIVTHDEDFSRCLSSPCCCSQNGE